jgi:hypothetical protein
MTPLDIRALELALTELASFYNRKAPSEMAVRVWLRRCKHLPIEHMTAAIEEWMAASPHHPTIDAIAVRAGELYARQRRTAEEASRSFEAARHGRPLSPQMAERVREQLARIGRPPTGSPRDTALRTARNVRDGVAMPPHFVAWARGLLGTEFDAVVGEGPAA